MGKMEDGIKLYQSFLARDPRKSSFGILIEDMSHGAYAMHAVMWFNSRDECAEFFKTYWDPMFGELEEAEIDEGADEEGEDDWISEADDFRKEVEKIRAAGVTEETLKVLSQGSQEFMWSGTFAELCAGEDEIPRQIVAKFRGRSDKNPKPIGPDDVEDFIEFLLDIQDNS